MKKQTGLIKLFNLNRLFNYFITKLKVYVRGLPYTIAGNEITLWENELKEKFERFAGKVVKIKIFPYSEFLSLKEQSKNIYSLNPSQLSNNEEFWDFLKNENTSKNKEQAPKTTNAEIKFGKTFRK